MGSLLTDPRSKTKKSKDEIIEEAVDFINQFYASVKREDSKTHKERIEEVIKSINETYGILAKLYQIKEIPFKELKCDFHVNHDDKESILKGVAKVLTRFPLKVGFTANENEMKFLYNSLSDNQNELELDCQYKSDINGLSGALIVDFEKEIKVIEFFMI